MSGTFLDMVKENIDDSIENESFSTSSSESTNEGNTVFKELDQPSGIYENLNGEKGTLLNTPEIIFSSKILNLYSSDGNKNKSLDYFVSQLILDANC